MEYKMGEVEMKFAMLIWENEPILSRDLAKLSEKELNWKKTTTYTVLKRLCEKGIMQNDRGLVSSLVSYHEFQAKQSENFVDNTFSGSLPKFVAAFCSQRKLNTSEILELQKIIDENK